ncbi:collagenase-like [Chironomus tepperi]|uniref:collagenase-like n=1 Tax=Chironomus tepperi TaxID=113505 RepID=UPI00391F9B59
MKQKILFLFSIILIISFVECRRIAGGWDAEPGSVSWHVKVEPSNGSFRRLCGGALIKYNWVLTAGQCLYNARDVIVRLGVINRLDGAEPAIFWVRNREHIIVHENYDENPERGSHTNDIGLIYLEESDESILDITDEQNLRLISTVPLLTDANLIPEGQLGIASGFGFYSDGPDAIQSMTLQLVDMTVMDLDQCIQRHAPEVVTEYNICTNTTGGKSTCIGDEGAPLVSVHDNNIVLVGIGSTALLNCQQEIPAIFTSVPKYLDWILNEIEDAPGTDTTTTDYPETTTPPDDRRCNCVCNCITCPAPAPIEPTKSKPKVNYFWKN